MPLDTLIDNAWFVAGRSSEFPVNEPKGLQICGQAGVRINKKPAEAGFVVCDSTACGAAQCTTIFLAAAAAFFGSVSSSTPSVYLARAVASSTSWPSENARWILP